MTLSGMPFIPSPPLSEFNFRFSSFYSFIASGNAKWHSHFRRRWQCLTKLNTVLPTDAAIIVVHWFSAQIVFCTQLVWKLLSARKLAQDCYCSFIHHHPKLEAAKMFFRRQRCKQNVEQPCNGIIIQWLKEMSSYQPTKSHEWLLNAYF